MFTELKKKHASPGDIMLRPPLSLGTPGHCPHVIYILAGDFVEIMFIFMLEGML
jgi:hypothetical protein